METVPIYFAKNTVEVQVYPESVQNTAYKAIVLRKNADGEFIIKVNESAPLRSDFIKEKGYVFDIRHVLSNIFDNDATVPGTENIKKIKNYCVPIKVLTSSLVGQDEKTTDVIRVLNGYLKNRLFSQFGHEFGSITKRNYKEFLSTAPELKVTAKNVPEYLYFIGNIIEYPNSINVYANVIYTDATTEQINLSLIEGLTQTDVVFCNVSLDFVQSKSMKKIAEYEIFLSDENLKRISTYRQYIVDIAQPEIYYTLLYKTSLGTFDTAYFPADRDEFIEFDNQSFDTESETIDYFTEVTTKLHFRTGNLIQGYLDYLTDELSLSKEIYWLKDGRKIRLSKAGKTLKKYDPTLTQDSAIFEFRISKSDKL